uniref:YdcF-like protein n=1 Tax=uncultured bacterium CSL11 TaxID=1091566 RepID=G4WVD7_9BACT|nr:YdcF-like protein [uncultured bacterium CSL11]
MDPLWLKAVLKALILPPTGLLLLAAVGIACQTRLPRIGRALAAAGVGLLLLLSIPVVSELLTDVVDTSVPLELSKANEANAIVILGGGIRRAAPEYGGDTLATLTLERVRYGARVARLTGLPVLVSGGTVLRGEPEATLMRSVLENEYNVRVRWSEPRSRTTHENAVRSAELLRQEGIRRVVLVAHGFDMRRAIAEFAAQGIETIPAPIGKRGDVSRTILDFLPSMAGLQQSYFATYEILANLVRVSSGR